MTAVFLSKCALFNDRQAWQKQDIEQLARSVQFEKFAINHVLWHAGDPVSGIRFVPLIRRGEADVVVGDYNSELPHLTTHFQAVNRVNVPLFKSFQGRSHGTNN